MSKKTNLSGSIIFSTNPNFNFEEFVHEDAYVEPKNQNLEAAFSNKGRGGKIVTIIRGFKGSADDLNNLAKLVKTALGVGGSIKDNEIIIQGNHRDKVMVILKAQGYNVKRVGG